MILVDWLLKMIKRVRLSEKVYWKLTTAKVVFKTDGFDPENKSCVRITKREFRVLKDRGYRVAKLERPSAGYREKPGWWLV